MLLVLLFFYFIQMVVFMMKAHLNEPILDIVGHALAQVVVIRHLEGMGLVVALLTFFPPVECR